MASFKKKQAFRVLDGYRKMGDGYMENPLAHYKNAPEHLKQEEYFMQWVLPLKLQRVALRTPIGYRIIHLYAKDLWNNRLGIKIPNDKERTIKINQLLTNYLISRRWFREMEKVSAYEREQGEAILLCYYKDEGGIEKYKYPVSPYAEILKVEAFSPLHYQIPQFDKYGDPALYRIEVKTPDNWRGIRTVDVHPSRVIRKCANNIEHRFTGYSDLAAVYDPIVILSSILKSTGEAALRWATGHPVFLTKDIFDETDLNILKDGLGDFSRRSVHILPSEKIEKVEMIGQAGSMINFKALADICVENVVMGTGIPRPILLGEVAGVISGSEVNERSYFALLDRDHTELEPFVREYFSRDINIRKLLNGVEYFELDWGIREVLNKMEEAEYKQKMVSNALAMTTVCTINESRKYLDMPPVPEESGGDAIGNVILGALPVFEMLWTMEAQEAEMEMAKEEQINTSMNQKARST
ncbi:MAG: anti-CBASS protein Acb1 family protein, partial [Candidatus Hermodarchaeota archaeon]